MQERLGELYADLERVMPHLRGSTADRCRSLFAVHYAFEFRRLRLFLAYVAAAFDWRAEPGLPVMGANPRLRGMVLRVPGRGASPAATCAPTPTSSWPSTC